MLRSVLFAAAIAAPASAEVADTADIIVTGQRDAYRVEASGTAAKTPTRLLDTPQAVSVLTAERLRDQAIRSVADLVRLVPGASAGQGEGHRDQVTLRGNNTTADFFVDGLRDDAQYFRSFYNVDRVEVLKGANAMIFGRGGGGGVINRVTKAPIAGRAAAAATASADSFGAWYFATDLNVDVGPVAVRLNAFHEQLETHRDAYEGDRSAVNPVALLPFASGALTLGYEYVRDVRVVDRGVPSAGPGTLAAPAGPLRGFRDAYFGRLDANRTTLEGHSVPARLETELGGGFSLSAQALWSSFDKFYSNIYPAAPAAAGAVAVEAYADSARRDNLIGQANLVWRGATGALGHVLLLGAEYTRQLTRSERANGFFDASLNAASRRRAVALAAQPAIPPVAFVRGPAAPGNRQTHSRLRQWSVYAQDQLSFTDAVQLIAGLRYDRFELEATNLLNGSVAARTDHLWSPRAGLVLKPGPNASIYASASRSFLPQSGDQFTSLDAVGAALEPERFDNYEVGAKWEPTPALAVAVAAYRLDRLNSRAPGAVAGTVVQTGRQRSRGIEAEATGRLTDGLDVALAYAFTDAKVTQATAAAPAGRTVAQVPRHQVSLWAKQRLADGIRVAAGLLHQGRSFASISNTVALPAYIRADAALFVKLGDWLDAQLNVENLFNTGYFPVAHNDNNIGTGAPRNARLTLTARF